MFLWSFIWKTTSTSAMRFGLYEDELRAMRKRAAIRIDGAKTGTREDLKSGKHWYALQKQIEGSFNSRVEEAFKDIKGMDLDRILSSLKIALEQQVKNYKVYDDILIRLEEIVIDEPEMTGKDEILRILWGLAYF